MEKRLSKHKMTIFYKNVWGATALCPHLATPMRHDGLWWAYPPKQSTKPPQIET